MNVPLTASILPLTTILTFASVVTLPSLCKLRRLSFQIHNLDQFRVTVEAISDRLAEHLTNLTKLSCNHP